MEQRQLPDDFKDFIQCLNSNEVRYLLVGGHAEYLSLNSPMGYTKPQSGQRSSLYLNTFMYIFHGTEFGIKY